MSAHHYRYGDIVSSSPAFQKDSPTGVWAHWSARDDGVAAVCAAVLAALLLLHAVQAVAYAVLRRRPGLSARWRGVRYLFGPCADAAEKYGDAEEGVEMQRLAAGVEAEGAGAGAEPAFVLDRKADGGEECEGEVEEAAEEGWAENEELRSTSVSDAGAPVPSLPPERESERSRKWWALRRNVLWNAVAGAHLLAWTAVFVLAAHHAVLAAALDLAPVWAASVAITAAAVPWLWLVLPVVCVLWRPDLLTQRAPFAEYARGVFREYVALLRRRAVLLLSLTAVVAALAVLLSGASCGLCLPDEPSSIDASTRLSRWIGIGSEEYHCTGSKSVCFVYVLAGRDMSTEAHVIYHTPSKISTAAVRIGRSSSALNTTVRGRARKVHGIDTDRYVSSVYVRGLLPDTTYFFTCAGDADGAVHSFRTAPAFDSLNAYSADQVLLNFAVAGDIGAWSPSEPVADHMSREDPYFIVIGGDIAYDNSFPTCHLRWDRTLNLLSTRLIDSAGRHIPLVVVVGNHETGGQRIPSALVPFMIDFFPYEHAGPPDEYGEGATFTEEAYDEMQRRRRLYHAHVVPGLLLCAALDSGLVNSFSGPQSHWLRSTLAGDPDIPFSIAAYHFPLYPSFRLEYEDTAVTARMAWQRYFDAYNLSVAFEHHDHNYKRTPPIRGSGVPNHSGEPAPGGTVYVGAAMWAVEQVPLVDDRWYIANDEVYANGFISVRVTSRDMTFSAVAVGGGVLDSDRVPARWSP